MLRNLAEFLTLAEDAGNLLRVQMQVSPQMESSLLCKSLTRPDTESKVIFCEEVTGSEIPLVCNLLTSHERVLLAAHCDHVEEGFERILSYFKPPQKTSSWMDLVQKIGNLQNQQPATFNKVKQGACQQVLRLGRDVDLAILPQIQHTLAEVLPVITRGIVQIQSADQSLSVSRQLSVSILDSKHLAVHFEEDRILHHRVQLAIKAGQQIAVVILLGGDPVIELAHFGRAPLSLDPMLLMSLFSRQAIDVVPCRSLPIHIPCETEIVIEGIIDPRIEQVEIPGCLLSHGHLSPVSRQPVVQVQAITHRANPIYPDMMRGLPRGEEFYLARFWERIMLKMMQLVHPEIVDISFPCYGSPDQLLFVSLEKRKPYHARQIASFIWSWEFPLVPRSIIIVDAGVAISEEQTVWQVVSRQVDYSRDLIFETASAELNHAVPTNTPATTRMAIDATRKWTSEGYPGSWPQQMSYSIEVKERVEMILTTINKPSK